MLTVSESIRLFLNGWRNNGRNGDFIDHVLEHGTDLELQVNVSPAGGELVDGTISTYTDGVNRWHSFRIPKNAWSDPFFEDYKLRFPLDKHVESMGSTGWLWKQRRSLWCAFDFDAITGHAEGVGIPEEELSRVKAAVSKLDYVEVRRSTGGAGLHLYVYMPDGVETQNHHEHAAVARCVLSKISEEVGFDLCQQVDVCGQNTWFWARRATDENQGFSLLKKATEKYYHDLSNWRDHLSVVNRSRPRVSIGVAGKEEDLFTQLTTAHKRVPLDESHKAVRDALAQMGCSVWVNDYHLLQTHTVLLKRLLEVGPMEIEGIFETNSPGSNTNQPNCFMFPIEDGSWRVFRFGMGTAEHKSWQQDGKGWTTTYFNRRPSLDAAAPASGGKPLNKGGYEFSMLKDAVSMIKKDLASDENLEIDVPEKLATRRAVVRKSANGMIVIEVPRSNDDGEFPNWNCNDKKGFWTQLVATQAVPVDPVAGDYDNILRCLKTPNNDPAGWAVLDSDGWARKAPASIKMILQSFGHAKPEAEIVMGQSELKSWRLVTQPFAPEYPGDRKWNLNAPQLAVKPAPPNDGHESQHPHWDMMLDHIGLSMNRVLRDQPWAVEAGICTGREYLQAWYANILRFPFAPLPYLFLYGPENSGKSIFHEAFDLLVTRGVVKADKALTSEFNGELEGCILAVVEEKDLSTVQGTHAKIKDFVNANKITIRRMRTDAYEIRNTTHWVQCSNDIAACPVFPGDTRITVLHVPEIKKEIPKSRLKSLLEEEAPYFLTTLLNMKLPKPSSRLQIPVVVTDEKLALAASNRSPVQWFIDEHCERGRSYEVHYTDFFNALQQEITHEQLTKQRVSRELTAIQGVSIRAGASNKRIITGIRLKESK